MREALALLRIARSVPAIRSDMIGTLITLGLFAALAIGLAAITGDA